ncbi:unnamed protein product [Lymnaea stagnalis]|uniref:Alpha/beta hydrolase fold-3 domain-containing protein n=1 Tax=Lymnaea stagnalis TaxID=6523 RepID=A0AAV2H8T9_LYMST
MSSAHDAWSPWSDKYVIDEETLAATQLAIDGGFKSFHELTLEDAKRQYSVMFHEGLDLGPFDGTITDLTVPSENVATGIPVSVLKPSQCPEVPVILIYYHGGGLVVLNKGMYSYCVRSLATKAKAIVVNVEYRLLPCPEDPLAPLRGDR